MTQNPDSSEPRLQSSGKRSSAQPTFEAAFGELQHVVEQLEDGGLDLDRALQLFDQGTRLAQTCQEIIDKAELRVTRLMAESASPMSEGSQAP